MSSLSSMYKELIDDIKWVGNKMKKEKKSCKKTHAYMHLSGMLGLLTCMTLFAFAWFFLSRFLYFE